jgi:hypothetical protein
MAGETNLVQLLKGMSPQLNKGEFVFVTVKDTSKINRNDTISEFKEHEGTTLIIERKKADTLKLEYHFIVSWITLNIHSALEAVGLTAAISKALTEQNISCNIVAGFYHDHIFVDKNDANNALEILRNLSDKY